MTFVTWLWRTPGYRSTFTAAQVNVLARMIARHYPQPFRLVCVTNLPDGLDPSIEVVPDTEDYASVPSPHNGKNPSCYRRLRMFQPDIGATFGDRFVSLDVDTVITGDLTALFNRPEPFVAWQDPEHRHQYNGSVLMLTAGARPHVWDQFTASTSPQQAKQAGYKGSDQAWISYALGHGEPTWTQQDGVYSFRVDLNNGTRPLPTNAKLVSFHGGLDPWHQQAQRLPWVQRCYQ